MEENHRLTVEDDMEGERLDVFVADNMEQLSRSMVQNLIKEGRILVAGQPARASYRVKEGDSIEVQVPDLKPVAIIPQDIFLPILYQDDDLVVVDKPKGMVVHPAHGNWDNTMVNALLYHVRDLSGINGELRPGIVHRLDKDTSGVMVAAKNDYAHRSLAEQIKEHTIKREYTALVHGVIKENLGTIDAPIGRSKTTARKWPW
jgi:23S rRNA pseudouridine1911/1915/1917 synthase